jgi:hypothetical protein
MDNETKRANDTIPETIRGFRIVFWDVLPCKIIVNRRFRGTCCLHRQEAARTSETSVDNYFTRQYIQEDNSELHTRRRENLKSHIRDLPKGTRATEKNLSGKSAFGLRFKYVRPACKAKILTALSRSSDLIL